jgi:hypothetical protein
MTSLIRPCSTTPTIFDFYASWCEPCKTLTPVPPTPPLPATWLRYRLTTAAAAGEARCRSERRSQTGQGQHRRPSPASRAVWCKAIAHCSRPPRQVISRASVPAHTAARSQLWHHEARSAAKFRALKLQDAVLKVALQEDGRILRRNTRQ